MMHNILEYLRVWCELLLVEFPYRDVSTVVCGDDLLRPNSQASDGRSKTSRNGVNASIFQKPSSLVSFDGTNRASRT